MKDYHFQSLDERLIFRAGWAGWAVFWILGGAFLASEGFARPRVPHFLGLALIGLALLGGVVSGACAFRILAEDIANWRHWILFLVLGSPWLLIASQAPLF